MTDDQARDGTIEVLAGLPRLEPDERRAARARARCHRVLAKRAGARRGDVRPRLGELVVSGAISVAFLVDVLRRALMLYGF